MDNRMPANGSAHSGDSVAPLSDAADAVKGSKSSTSPCHKRRLFRYVLMQERYRLLLHSEHAAVSPGRLNSGVRPMVS
jgi:hypothetical protein